jgi:uncharacterized protein YecT (DUF1311 family)
MTNKALIRRLQISCLGLDPIDPLRLLVDDVIAALTQKQRTWVELEWNDMEDVLKEANGKSMELWEMFKALEAKIKERNT